MSTLKVESIQHPSSSTPAISLDSNGAMTGSFPSPNRNLIYNGAMQVAQRGTSTTGITTAGIYTADRWNVTPINLGTWTQTIENDAPSGSGLRKSLKMLCTTADAAPAAGDLLFLQQILEGQDVQRIAKGTSSAQQLTLSFWVKSNVTGTYIARLRDADNSRSVQATYSITASGTWEKKVITFPADTTGVLDNDNNGSLVLQLWLAAGSDYTSGTLQTTWAASVSADIAPGQTNLAAATNNYWQVTGVQLEVGPTATPFEFKSYGAELAECQRYYESVGFPLHYAAAFSSTDIYLPVYYAVTKRATPTITLPSATNAVRNTSGTDKTPEYAWTTGSINTSSFSIYAGAVSLGAINAGTATVAAEL